LKQVGSAAVNVVHLCYMHVLIVIQNEFDVANACRSEAISAVFPRCNLRSQPLASVTNSYDIFLHPGGRSLRPSNIMLGYATDVPRGYKLLSGFLRDCLS
jgi:hypothetical protein